MAFLGKISAVLTANTQDFTRNVREAGKDLEAFRKQTAGFQLNLNTDSLNKTLTKVQLFQRQVDEIRKQIAANPSQASLFPDPSRMMGQFKALQDVGRPLIELKNKIEGLSTAMQAGLYPELGKIQAGFQGLFREIGSGATTFEKEEARVKSLTVALERLGRTASIAADFGKMAKSLDANNTGASFYQPRAKEALQESLSLRGKSEQVPAKLRGSMFAALAQDAEANANAIEAQAARILRINNVIARRGETPARLEARETAQSNLDALTARQEFINSRFRDELKTSDLSKDVGGLVGGMEARATGAFRSQSSLNREKIAQQGMLERAALLKMPELSPEELQRRGALSKIRENAALEREDFSRTTLGRYENLSKIGQGIDDKGFQRELENIRSLSMEVDADLRKSFSSENTDEAAAALARYKDKLASLNPLYDKLEKKASSLSNAQKQADMFRAASGGRGDKLDPTLERAASDIMTARQLRGQYAENNISGRSRVGQEIEDTTKRVEELTRQRARIENQDRPEEVKIRAYQKINQLIKEQTDLLLKKVAAESGGLYKDNRVTAIAERARKNTGSFGAPGAAAAQLAMQQGLFAIDDLMSATGGLEYKLRAVGNNITQLGLLLGQSGLIPGLSATAGLFIGLSAVMGGQALSALLRWTTGAEDVTARTEAMNASLSKQKSIVESLGQAFKSLGDATSQGTRSSVGERDSDFKKQMEEVRRKQAEQRKEKASNLDSDVQAERIKQIKLGKRLENATDAGQRSSILAEIEASKRREGVAAEGAVQRARTRAGMVAGGRDRIEVAKELEARLGEKKLAAEDRGFFKIGSNSDIAKAREEALDLQKSLDAVMAGVDAAFGYAANIIVEASRGPAEQIRLSQEEVAKAIQAGVPGARLFGLELDKTASQLDEANKKLRQAIEGKDAEGNKLSVDKRDELMKSARAEIDSLEEKRGGLLARTDSMRTARLVDPQSQIDERLARARQNLGASGASDGSVARRMREIEDRREQIRAEASRSENQTPKAQAQFAAMEAALNKEAAAIEATTLALKMFSEAIAKAADEVKGNLSAAQQRYDQARRADIGMGTPQTKQDRDIAEFDLGRQRTISDFTQKALIVQGALEEEMKRGPEFTRMQEIDEELKSGKGSLLQKGLLLAERAALEEKVRPQIEASRKRSEAITEASVAEEERQKSAARGRDLIKTPDKKFAEETESGLKSIREAFGRESLRTGKPIDSDALAAEEERYRRSREKESRSSTMIGRGRDTFLKESERFARDIRDPGGLAESMTAGAMDQAGLMNVEGRAELLRKGISNQMESVAPMMKQFEDERVSAQLTGPSRAALNASDVATGQGASELTRLLRRDDSARDVNLAELQKQTQKFDELITAIKEANPGVLL